MGVTLKQETNKDLLQALQDRGYTVVDVDHEHDGNRFTRYRVIHPDLQGHFTITDRYDYFENLGYGYGRKDCRFWVNSDYERVDRERSEGSPPIHTIGHYVAQEPEECLDKLDEWALKIAGGDEKWIIAEWHEPVRYYNTSHIMDWTLSDGVEIWKPSEEKKEPDPSTKMTPSGVWL